MYGTLLDPACLRRKSGAVRARLVPAVLPGWHRVWREAYPTLRRGGVVKGALVRVSARSLGKLAAYEGDEYQLRGVTARLNGKPVRCRVWLK